MHKIGIDFGTSYCTSSRLNPVTGKPEVITFHETGLQKMPSLVYYSPDGVMVGDPVADMFENSVSLPEEEREDLLGYTYSGIKRQLQRGMKVYGRDGRVLTQAEIISEILRKIKHNAEQTCFSNEAVEWVVLTHPVCFAEWQKEILVESARLAGFVKVDLMEEPVAAARGYVASGIGVGRGVLVYDFGGGTFDVAFVSIDEEGEYRVPVLPEGDLYCGGDDLDLLLYHYWENQIKQELDRSICPGGVADAGFLTRCRKHKEALTIRPSIDQYEILPPPGFVRRRLKLDRSTFESLIGDYVNKTITRTRSLLQKVEDAGFEVDTVVLIGGSSRLPLVTDLLKTILPIEPLKTMLVDAAVALGAVVPDRVYTAEEMEELCKKASRAWYGKKEDEAVRLWRKVAESGSKEAQLNLGICYHQGVGVGQDASLAAKYYDAAAAQGGVVAAYNRSVLLLHDLHDCEAWKRLLDYLQADQSLANGFGKELLSRLLAVNASPQLKISKKGVLPDDFVLVEGGTFQMDNAHSITLSAYYIGKYPVTQKLWFDVMGNNPSHFKGDDLPVEEVSWFDCISFCNALSRRDGWEECYRIEGQSVTLLLGKQGYRLPTEAEWEFAARGGRKSKGFEYAGSNSPGEIAWYEDNSGKKTHPVGYKHPNELGLFDMSGNVWEWCWDWRDDYPSSPQTNPLGPASGASRVFRGGSWVNSASDCRVANRCSSTPTNSYYSLGFRLVFVS